MVSNNPENNCVDIFYICGLSRWIGDLHNKSNIPKNRNEPVTEYLGREAVTGSKHLYPQIHSVQSIEIEGNHQKKGVRQDAV